MARPNRWDEVVRSAARVFRIRGYADASLEEIADNLGMWKGSLYNYISSKDELLDAVVRIPSERLLEDVRAIVASSGSAEQQLRNIVRCHVAILVDIYDFAAVYLHEVAGREVHPEWRKMDRKYVSLVQGVVARGIAEGEFRADLSPRLTTMTLLGALNWLTRWWDPQGSTGPEDVSKQIANAILGGISRGPTSTATRTGG